MNGFVSSRFTASISFIHFSFRAIHFCGRRTAWHLTNEQRRRWRSCDRSDRRLCAESTVGVDAERNKAQRETTTNGAGIYRFEGVNLGTYNLS